MLILNAVLGEAMQGGVPLMVWPGGKYQKRAGRGSVGRRGSVVSTLQAAGCSTRASRRERATPTTADRFLPYTPHSPLTGSYRGWTGYDSNSSCVHPIPNAVRMFKRDNLKSLRNCL